MPLSGQRAGAVTDEAMRRNNLGVALMDAGTRDPKYTAEAVREFDAALSIAPQYAIAQVNLGVALYYAGETQRATRVLEQVIAARPDSLQAQYVLGLLREYAGQHEVAARHFRRVTELDPADADAWYHLGFTLARSVRSDEAVTAYRRAATITPYQRRIRYGLFMALSRAGRAAEAQSELEAFRRLGDSQVRVVEGPKNPLEYLKQGRHAETIADSHQAATQPRRPTYVDVTTGAGITAIASRAVGQDVRDALAGAPVRVATGAAGTIGSLTPALSVGAALVDVDGDGRLDAYTLQGGAHALFVQHSPGRFARVAAFPAADRATAAAWGDIDNDALPDLVIGERTRIVVFGNRKGRLSSRHRTVIPLPAGAGVAGLALADVDHDGDLDIAVTGGVDTRRPRRTGPVRFPDDFEPRPNLLLRNNGDGTFLEVGRAAGLATGGAPAFRVWFSDLDDDRAVDAVLVDARGGQRVLLNRKDGTFAPTTSVRAPALTTPRLHEARAHGDVDGDGASDQLTVDAAGVRLLRNQARPRRWLTVAARGYAVPGKTKSNRLGIGTRIEVRSPGLWERREVRAGNGLGGTDAAQVTFDLGTEARLDFVRAVFPSGVRRTDTDVQADRAIVLEEPLLDVNSCPTLFTWNGERFEFITDTLSAGILGELVAPGRYWRPDPDEWVRIEGRQLAADAASRLAIRFTNPLEEVTYLDAVRLVAVDHPEGTLVHSDERMLGAPDPDRAVQLYTIAGTRAPARITDHHGHDVATSLAASDRRYFDHFTPLPFKGFAGDWSLTIDLGRMPAAAWPVLGLDGWSYWNSSAAVVAASQANERLRGPVLEVQDRAGAWRLATDDLGLPAGLPRTTLVDLRPYLREGEQVVRISANRTIYYDRIWIGDASSRQPLAPHAGAHLVVTPVPRTDAELRWLGYPRRTLPGGTLPDEFDYQDIQPTAEWGTHAGLLTRYGNVGDLLESIDDRLVIMGHGEEVALEFDAARLPPLRNGWTRTWFFYANGFEKGYEITSAHAETVGPLPFQGMSAFPYDPARAPADPSYLEYQMEWNTRPPFLRVPR